MDNLNDETKNSKVKFVCPNCGDLSREDVIFLCNTCNRDELIEKEGIYICPSCLVPGENFECMVCESKEVKMVEKKETQASLSE